MRPRDAFETLLAGLSGTWRRLRAETRAATTVTFVILSLPLLMVGSTMIVYSDVVAQKDRLNQAADAAALAAAGYANVTGDSTQAQAAALKIFNDQSVFQGIVITGVQARLTDSLTSRTVVVSYTGTVPVPLMGIFGATSMDISGSATAVTQLPTYIDFYLLLDNTPSMGIGATLTDIQTMVNNTPDQCGFACHDLASAPNDYYSKAKALGVTTRIDVVRQATQQLMDTATQTEYVPGQFRAAVYTFGTDATNLGLTRIAAINDNLATVKTQAGAIDLMTIPYQGYNNDQITDFNATLTSVNAVIPTPGNGTSQANAQKVLFMVSDGVNDSHNPGSCTRSASGGRCIEPLNTTYCDSIKARGIRIAVLYTTYFPLPTNSFYNTYVSPFQPTIGPNNMQSCASPGLYFEVAPNQGISAAMTALFNRAVGSARLSQ